MLNKEIEFPLFHRGTEYDSDGKPVVFTDDMLRTMERNGNFLIRSGVLRAPIKYDHPAFGAPNKENHGRIVGYKFRDGSLFATGTNWSDTLVNDVKREARIAYSGEYKAGLDYFDPITNERKKIDGPVPCGLSILGGDRPAIKNLKPLQKFDFGEGVSTIDEWETREGLRKAGLIAEYCDSTHFFGEVENDASRFFEEQENAMTPEELKTINDGIKAGIAAAVEPLNAKIEAQGTQIKQFGEEAKTRAKVTELVETIGTEKNLSKISRTRLEEALMTPTTDTVRAFAESISAVVLPGTTKKDDDKGGDDDDATEFGEEPKALAILRPKHFKDLDKYGTELAEGVAAFAEAKPKLFAKVKDKPITEQIEAVRQHVVEREAAAN